MGKKKWPSFKQAGQPQAAAHPSVSELTLEARQFTGPLPPPEQLLQYEQISPGFADRIVTMAEKEQENRHGEIRARIGLQKR